MNRKQFKIFIPLFLTLCIFYSLPAQVYEDHFGTGNRIGLKINSSPAQGVDSAAVTLNGTGYFTDLQGAARFLAQAGFGGTYEEIMDVTQKGIEPWLEEQFATTSSSYLNTYKTTHNDAINRIQAVYPNAAIADIARRREYTDYVFFEKVFKDTDVLRNKAAFALHQIFVVSNVVGQLKSKGHFGSDYYDVLYEGAFGNFRDMLSEVTLHPMMGYYLSHFQNEKGDPSTGALPDENFAREIMQLFTIGLFELNNDGTYKLDGTGQRIPTYDIVDIQELAKVFTGLSGAAWDLEAHPDYVGEPLRFNGNVIRFDGTLPMIMYEEHHEPGEKVMIDDTVIPAGQPGMQDIQEALDVLFNHPNVGPFIAIRLIQQLVKSNPTPAYVNRVATVFNNNGYGIRGDMKAVFKAILIDPEARECSWLETTKTGKLRQPLVRFINVCRAFKISSPSGDLWMSRAGGLINAVEQTFMGAPTVFNFFTPFYAESKYVSPNEMVSPEFQILHSVTSIEYLNWMETVITSKPFPNNTSVHASDLRMTTNNDDDPFLNFSDEIAILEANGATALLDRLDLLLCYGEMTTGTRSIIMEVLTELIDKGSFSSERIVETAIYLVVASADYTILK